MVFDAGMGDGASNTGTSGSSGTSGNSSNTVDNGSINTSVNSGDKDEVCNHWKADLTDMSEGVWSGSVATCDPGDISAEGRANALKIFNLYRLIADLPPIQTDPEFDRKAQACALLMRARRPRLWRSERDVTRVHLRPTHEDAKSTVPF